MSLAEAGRQASEIKGTGIGLTVTKELMELMGGRIDFDSVEGEGSQLEDDPAAAGELLPLVYDELRKLAAARMSQENPGQTLQATALVHEAYLRLVDDDRVAAFLEADLSLPAEAGEAAELLRSILRACRGAGGSEPPPAEQLADLLAHLAHGRHALSPDQAVLGGGERFGAPRGDGYLGFRVDIDAGVQREAGGDGGVVQEAEAHGQGPFGMMLVKIDDFLHGRTGQIGA